MKIKIGIPKALLYYYYKDLWKYFFDYLNIDTIESINTNKDIIARGEKYALDEICLSMKIYLGHIDYLKDKCDYILVPRLYSIKKNEQVCTNFSCLYDLVNNSFDNINILNYNIDLTTNNNELLGFLQLGKKLGYSYIETYKAYNFAKKKEFEERIKKENVQEAKIFDDNIKILIASHPYNTYDEMIGRVIINYLKKHNITIIYSDRIKHNLIDSESYKISTDLNWTHSKEVAASINYYKTKVDGIILLSAFPCGPDSLTNELEKRKVTNIPVLSLIFEDLNSDVGIITRIESFLDILLQKKELKYENN